MNKPEWILDKIDVEEPSLEGRGRCYAKGYRDGQRRLLRYLVKEGKTFGAVKRYKLDEMIEQLEM